MPEKQSSQAQTNSKGGNGWWVPLVVGIMMLFMPGGLYVAPIFFLLSIIMRRRKPKSPETSPSLLFQFTP
jgi:flagellar basal body-associated protein FliL